MKIAKSIFKAYDIRGIANKEIDEYHAKYIGKAIASESIANGVRSIVIGRDGRLTSHLLLKSLKEGLIESGCHVIDLSMAPTPLIYFAIFSKNIGSGVIVTASHNPKEYNGFKIVINYKALHSKRIQDIYKRIINEEYILGAGSGISANIEQEYIDNIVKDIKINKKLNIVIDCGNGVAGNIASKLFESLGIKVNKLFCLVDGNFPNHDPNPSKLENLKDIREEVIKKNADMGLAFDGDADRVVLIDNKANVIWPDKMMILYSREILKRNKNACILFDVKCSQILAKDIIKNKGKAIMAKTGHSFMKEKITEVNATLAGEMSGHFFFKDRWYGFDDAFYAAARLLEIISNSKKKCSEIFASLPDEVSTPEINIDFKVDGDQFKAMSKLKKTINFINAKIIEIDGIRVEYENSWGLVRASNTTPSLTIRFAAINKIELEKIKNQFKLWFKNNNIYFDNF